MEEEVIKKNLQAASESESLSIGERKLGTYFQQHWRISAVGHSAVCGGQT